jgi:hypothetical protein
MKKFIFLIAILFSNPAFAEGFTSAEATKTFSDNMLGKLYAEKFQEAFDLAKPYWPLPEVEIDGVVNAINLQWPIVNKRFGKATGTEFIKQEQIGNSFLRYYYLHKFENHAIYWRFDFYKPDTEWKINTIQFLDDLDTLFK